MHLAAIIIAAALLVAVTTDLIARRIPNWLVFPLMACGLTVQTLQKGWSGCIGSLEGIFLIVLLYSIPYLAGGLGAGDVKLLAAIAAWVGPHQAFFAFVAASIAGGMIALGWVMLNGTFLQTMRRALHLLCFWKRIKNESNSTPAGAGIPRSHMIPYSPAIAIGTAVSFLCVTQ